MRKDRSRRKASHKKKSKKTQTPIRINPEMKGAFTRKARNHKMTVKQYADHVIKRYRGKTKNPRDVKLLRQAVFVKNARSWKKGGVSKFDVTI